MYWWCFSNKGGNKLAIPADRVERVYQEDNGWRIKTVDERTPDKAPGSSGVLLLDAEGTNNFMD